MHDVDVALAMLDHCERIAQWQLAQIRQQRQELLDDVARAAAQTALDIVTARAERDPDFLIDRRDVREWEIDERAVQRRRVPQV